MRDAGEERGDLLEYGGGLLRFLAPTRSALSVLVVESLAYLPKLREMMPWIKANRLVDQDKN